MVVAPDELVVGVQDTVVRGENAAGAVFLYRLGNTAPSLSPTGSTCLRLPRATDWEPLLPPLQVSAVEGVLAGSPGDNSVMEFFCNPLMPANSKSARCP